MTTKILCLHGFLQNAKIFSEKSSGIRKLLKKLDIETKYIDGAVELNKEDLPFEVDDAKWSEIVDQQLNKAWFFHSDISKELDLSDAIAKVSDHIKEHGPYDGILGFSQGSALTAIITNQISRLVPGHPPFKFSVIFSGYSFTEPVNEADASQGLQITEKYRDAFTVPENFPTKTIHVFGSSDMAVPSERSKYLFNLYPEDKRVQFEHDGGHFVPNKKQFLAPIVEEIKNSL